MHKNDNDGWLEKFKSHLIKQDMAERTISGYLYDLKVFKSWIDDFYQQEINFAQVGPRVGNVRKWQSCSVVLDSPQFLLK